MYYCCQRRAKVFYNPCIFRLRTFRQYLYRWVMPQTPSKNAVLSLYRSLVRYGYGLELSDKKYFFKRLREEFETRKSLTDPKELQFYFNKGRAFLERKRLV